MAKNLVIVESPAKVKTIKKFIGSGYEVMASMGHVRDLPKSTIGIDVENDFVADGYVYEFKGTDNIALRDGQYVVEVSNAGAYVQKLTTDLVVKGADVTKEIAFSSDITEWDFSDAAFAAKCVEQGEGGYNGLTWTNAKAHQNTYLYRIPL